MNNKAIAAACLFCAIAGGAITYHWLPRSETVTVEHEVVKDRVVTNTVEVDKPDGTKTITTHRTDAIIQRKDETSKTVVSVPAPQYHISVGATIDRIYSVQVEKKVLGPISLGLRAESTGQVAAIIGLEF